MTTQTMWHVAFRHSDDNCCDFGDYQEGTARYTEYRKDGEPWIGAEVAYYVEYVEARNQPGKPMRYVVTCRVSIWKGDPADAPEAWRETNEEISYPDCDVLYYETIEQAQRSADRFGKMDESNIFLD